MIGIPENFVPPFIKKNRKNRYIIIMIVLFLLIITGYFFIRVIREGIQKGPDFSELRLIEAKRMLDSCALGLDRYFKDHDRYPQCNDKYFFDSIKQYINIHEAYVYADSITTDGHVIPLKKKGGRIDYLKTLHSYIGIGSYEQYITYESLTLSSYKLYSVGENYIDEGGKGDDIDYHK